MFFHRRLHRRFRYRDRVDAGGRCYRGFHRISRHFHEILGAFELAVFLAHLGFEAQGAASVRSEPAADFGSERSSDEATQGPPSERQRRFCRAFQPSAHRFSDGRTHNRANGLSGFTDQVTQESIQFGFIGDFEQLPS